MVSNDGVEAVDALPPSFVPRRADADDAFVTRRFTPDQCAEDDEVCLPSTCAVAGDDLLLPLMSMNLTERRRRRRRSGSRRNNGL
jgi:hypothetical protein